MTTDKDLIGVREAASRLGVHENTIRNWEKRGVLRAARLLSSGIRRFSAADVARMREEMMTQFAPATVLPDRRGPVDADCRGSGRPGVMPGAGKQAAEEWEHYRAGRLRCPYCGEYVAHTERGTLTAHAR